jgi:hypothetical protein
MFDCSVLFGFTIIGLTIAVLLRNWQAGFEVYGARRVLMSAIVGYDVDDLDGDVTSSCLDRAREILELSQNSSFDLLPSHPAPLGIMLRECCSTSCLTRFSKD